MRLETAGVVLAYAVVTVVIVEPLVRSSALGSASHVGDARLVIWILAWDNHAVLPGRPLFESNIFYPASQSLAYTEHLLGVSLFTLQIYAATANPVLAYNVVWMLSYLLNRYARPAEAVRRRTRGSVRWLTRLHLLFLQGAARTWAPSARVDVAAAAVDRAAGAMNGAHEIVDAALATGEYDLIAQVGADYAFRVRPEAR